MAKNYGVSDNLITNGYAFLVESGERGMDVGEMSCAIWISQREAMLTLKALVKMDLAEYAPYDGPTIRVRAKEA